MKAPKRHGCRLVMRGGFVVELESEHADWIAHLRSMVALGERMVYGPPQGSKLENGAVARSVLNRLDEAPEQALDDVGLPHAQVGAAIDDLNTLIADRDALIALLCEWREPRGKGGVAVSPDMASYLGRVPVSFVVGRRAALERAGLPS